MYASTMLPRERLTLQRRVQQQMRMRGLSISKDGLERLLDFIELNGLDVQAAVDLLISGLDQLNCEDSPRFFGQAYGTTATSSFPSC